MTSRPTTYVLVAMAAVSHDVRQPGSPKRTLTPLSGRRVSCIGRLVLLCRHHHRLIHSGPWHVQATAPGVFEFTGPVTPTRRRTSREPPTAEPRLRTASDTQRSSISPGAAAGLHSLSSRPYAQ